MQRIKQMAVNPLANVKDCLKSTIIYARVYIVMISSCYDTLFTFTLTLNI